MSIKRVVVIGGGTGTFTVLQALRDVPVDLTAIVSTADDGGSTGILRDELGVLPPGDLRQALVALSPEAGVLRDLLSYRFENGGLKGHSFGNLLISALEKVTGSFDQAIVEVGRILNIHGRVLPVTTDQMHLRAENSAGEIIKGEHAIEEHLWQEQADLGRFWLESSCAIHPLAREAIVSADLIVLAPGSFFTSLVPNFLVDGMKEALSKTKATIVYVSNLMTEKGQTSGFSVQDYADLIERYAGPVLDYALYNARRPSKDLLLRYQAESERAPVIVDKKRMQNYYELLGANLIGKPGNAPSESDILARKRTLIRHDQAQLARAITALLYLKDAKEFLHA